MNFFFLLAHDEIKGFLNIPKFQNRGKFFKKNIKLYEYKIVNKNWQVEECKCKYDKFFWELSSDDFSTNSIFGIHKENEIKSKNIRELKKLNNLSSTYPDFRGNNKVLLNGAGFSSYQSDYPYEMIHKNGSILSPLNILLNNKANNNLVFFRNIFYLPLKESFEIYIIDIKKFKILKKFICKTNELNILNIENQYLKNNNYLFSNKYIGIPIFYSEFNKQISLEHTHPPHEYILSNDRFKTIGKIKKEIYEKIFK